MKKILFAIMVPGCLCLFSIVPVAQADTLDTNVIALFPKNASQLSYADLSEARQHAWFAPFESQVLPENFLQFEQLLESPQMGMGTEVDTVAWAMAPASPTANTTGDIVGVAIGHFNEDTAQSFAKARQLPSWEADKTTIYESQTGWGGTDIFFAFLDSDTVIFGPRDLVARLIEVHNGSQESLATNEPMMGLIRQVNGNGVFWSAMGGDAARQAILQLVPGAAKFPQAQQLFGQVTAMLITVDDSSDTDVALNFCAISASPQDAVTLSQLLQAGVLMRRYEATTDNPSLAEVLDNVSIAPNGIQLTVSLDVTDRQILELMESDTFVL